MAATLAGKTLFITGASRGIGKAIALRAAADGANVVIAAKTAEPHPKLPGTVFSAAKEIEAAGGKALPCVVDIRHEEDLEKAVRSAVECFGGIDIVVNNASAISLTGTAATPMKRYDLMNQINARGTYLTTKTCLPYLQKAANPHILTISPPLNMNKRWFKNHVAYTIAKYGMSMCTLGWAEEFKDQGIAANALWPRTAIATAAMEMLGGQEAVKQCRTSEIMADAAYYILCSPSTSCTGNFFIDEEVVKEHDPEVNLEKYACVPGNDLIIDFFLDEAELVKQDKPNQVVDTAQKASTGDVSGVDKVFAGIKKAVTPALVSKVKGIYQFDIKDGDEVKTWTVDLKNGAGAVIQGAGEEAPGCTITMTASDFQDMVSGKLKGQMAFMTGKLKIAGNMGMALKLENIFKAQAKL